MRFDLTTYSNERWQIDNHRLDIWVRVWVIGHWEVREAWLSVVLDAHSRAIAGFIVSLKHPDAWTTLILLRQAILPKENKDWLNRGITYILQPDRGKEFMAVAVQASIANIGILCDPDPPYYPNRKGRVERFFLSLDHHLRIFPGHHKNIGSSAGAAKKNLTALLTREQLQAEIEHWIVNKYHQREHTETKRAPAELWQETVRLRMPESEELLDSFLLKSDKVRKIRNTGIDFHIAGKGDDRGGRYWSPELAWFYAREVTVSYNPEDLNSILVYCAATNEYLGEAWLMGDKNSKYSIVDVKQARSQTRRGLLERKKMYSAEIHQKDREAVKRENWRLAREQEKETEKFLAAREKTAKAAAVVTDNSVENDIFAAAEAAANKLEEIDRSKLI